MTSGLNYIIKKYLGLKIQSNWRNSSYKDFKFNGSITFNSVSFVIQILKLIKDLHLKINQKESIGITGKSGSGKSTLLDLLTGIINQKKEIY